MSPKPRNRNWQDVLRYRPQRASQSTIARYYAKWRNEQGIPRRCDNQACVFNVEKLLWNDKSLPLILDHLDGNNKDNRPEKLRYLCPNCDAQLTTRGGGNKGRVEHASENQFTLLHRDGTRLHELFIQEELSIAESRPSVLKRRS